MRWEKRWTPASCGQDPTRWESVWEELTHGYPAEAVPKGTVLYEQGDLPTELIFLHHGQAQVESCHSDGKKRVVYMLFDGLPVGETECIFGTVREFRAVCLTECWISRVPTEEFRRRVERSHALAVKLLQVLARKSQVLSRSLIRDSFLPVDARMARFLLSRAEYYGKPEAGGIQITLRMTQQEMADYLGVSRVAVNQCLNDLRHQGLIDRQGRRLLLKDMPALQRLSDGPSQD